MSVIHAHRAPDPAPVDEPMPAPEPQEAPGHHPGPVHPVPQDDPIMLGVFGATSAQQRRGQPVSYVRGAEPPMLLLQGTNDSEVEPSNAISLYRATQAVHGDSTLRTYPGIGHEALLFTLSRPMKNAAPTLHDVLAFIQSHPHANPVANTP